MARLEPLSAERETNIDVRELLYWAEVEGSAPTLGSFGSTLGPRSASPIFAHGAPPCSADSCRFGSRSS